MKQLIGLLFLLFLLPGCDADNCTVGSGNFSVQELEVGAFQGINNSTLVDVVLVADTLVPWQAQFSGDDNLLDQIELVILNGIFEINNNNDCISTTQPLELILQDGSFGTMVNSGSGNITGVASLNNAELRNSGSGDIILTDGRNTGQFNITNSGSGDVNTNGIEAENMMATNSGSGDIYLTATETLDVTISGSGDVYYKGDPLITPTISGSGELIDDN